MRRGRGSVVQQEQMVEMQEQVVTNLQKQTSFSIEKFTIGPGQSLRVSQEIMENESMKKWLAQGLLRIDKPGKPFKRYIGERPMRIIHFVHTLFGGGAERSTLEIHNGLKRYNITQWLVNLYQAGDMNRMLSEEARSIFDFVYECEIQGGWNTAATKNVVIKIIKEYDPDIIIYANIDTIPQFVKELIPRPPVIQIQHSELDFTVRAYKHGQVDAVVAVSETMARNRIRENHIPSKHVHPIWYGVNPARVTCGASLRKGLDIKEDDFVIGMVGNLNSLKRPIFGVEAFAQCHADDMHLLLSGNPQDQKEVREKADALGIGKYVHILGYRPDVENIYATIDVLLNCSITEGLPMTIIEAMFNSLPVVASAVGGNQEAVVHGLTGYLFSANDQDGLVKYISELHRLKRPRRRMGKAGFERASQFFHMDACADAYWELFNTFVVSADEPRCSVVMPVYNGEKTVLDAINSVLSQTMPFFEFIIVNDGSEDNTLSLLRDKAALDDRIRVVHQPHTGIVGALNHGISEARTEIIVRIDADDEMLPTRLEKQLGYFAEHPDIDILGSNMICRRVDGSIEKITAFPIEHKDIVEAFRVTNVIGHPAVSYRKSVWRAVGGYRGDGRSEDYVLWTDAAVIGFKFHVIEEPLTIYRLTHRGDEEYHRWMMSTGQEIRDNLSNRLQSRENLYNRPFTHIPLSGGA